MKVVKRAKGTGENKVNFFFFFKFWPQPGRAGGVRISQ